MKSNELEAVAEYVCSELDIRTPLGLQAVRAALKNLRTLDLKQRDYGRANLDEFGSYGVLVRTNDKISRLKNLYKQGTNPSNESVVDSWLDLANYGILGFIKTQDESFNLDLESNHDND